MKLRDRILTHAIAACFLNAHDCRADISALNDRETEIAFGIRVCRREPRQVQLMRVRGEVSNTFAKLNAWEMKAERFAMEIFA